MRTWVVPGCPLLDGSGWRIWYAGPKKDTLIPRKITVWQGDTPIPITQSNEALPDLKGLNRSLACATVQLNPSQPGASFKVHIPEMGEPRIWQTFPSQVDESGIRFLFGSCYWRNDDKEGHYWRAVDAIMRLEKPRKPFFKILAGDQIYLDFPVPLNPLGGSHGMVARRYRQYWGDETYQKVLAATPNLFLCDDHEWWNDFPERQRHLPHTYTARQRKAYGQAATDYYNLFQRQLNPGNERWCQFTITPVSFFFADSRSARDSVHQEDKTPGFFQEDQWRALETWQHDLDGPGILVTGMPLFQKTGDWKDHSLSNFPEDNRRLLSLLTRSLTGQNAKGRPHDIVILSGDIHTGRHCIANLRGHSGLEVHELIASPASRVGPALSEPSPSLPPGSIPDQEQNKWGDIRTEFTTVENNLGVIRLFPASKHPFRIRLEFANYLVRPHRRPTWKFWASEPSVDFEDEQSLRLYDNKHIYLK